MRSVWQLRTGHHESTPAPIPLRAGPTTALLAGADLRSVRRGGRELAQRIYMAVRDEVWGTVPADLSDLRVEQEDDSFRVTFAARNTQGAIDFEWSGQIDGEPDGTVTYAFQGLSRGRFRYCKLGFNVHHPLLECVGRPFRALTEDGATLAGSLPVRIEPQRVVNGTLTGMFHPYTALTIDYREGAEARFTFTGDLFELQDHRNWADGNYKSYGTPLSVPWPLDASKGERFEQRVVVSSVGLGNEIQPVGPVEALVDPEPAGTEPPLIGLGHPADLERPLTASESELLRLARPAHLRVPVRLHLPNWRAELEAGLDAALALGAAVELALSVEEDAERAIAPVARILADRRVPIARVLVLERQDEFTPTAPITTEASLHAVREALGVAVGGAPLAGGSDQFFSDLNRGAPQGDDLDALCFGLCPQVHAADDRSLMENLPALADCVRSARALRPGTSIAVSPVTLAPRLGPFPGGAADAGRLPGSVDLRLQALFGVSWTLGAVAWLTDAGAESATFYETVGWRGVVDRSDGSPHAELLSARPGEAFPVLHVFADLADLRSRPRLSATSSDPLAASVLAFGGDPGPAVLIANHGAERLAVAVDGLGAEQVRLRVLDETTAEAAIERPHAFRETWLERAVPGGRLELELAPYAVARVES